MTVLVQCIHRHRWEAKTYMDKYLEPNGEKVRYKRRVKPHLCGVCNRRWFKLVQGIVKF